MKCSLLSRTVVFLTVFCSVCSSVSGEAPVSEKSILLEIKSSVSDPGGVLSSWSSNSSDHHCSWFGVACDSESQVVSLSIAGNDEKGGNFRALSCSENLKFQFPVDGFGVWRNSSSSGGKLNGKISPWVGKLSELRVLSFAYNELGGEVPKEIWGLEKLEVLDLEGNLLTGKLPNRFSGLRKLRVLNLGFNRIGGEIPFSLYKCVDLEVLSLARNEVSGTIPGFLGGFAKLQGLYLAQNKLNGSIPSKFGYNCGSLEHLDLSGNSLVGMIPGSLGNCRRLQTLLLFSNVLDGVIPRELGQLQKLETLDVSRNSLSGKIPAELGECVNLSVLVLSNVFNPLTSNENTSVELSSGWDDDYNYYEGSIPEEITTLPNLKIVWAPRAALEGKLPSNWSGCEKLEMVNLAENLFSGELVGVFERCKKLHYLNLGSNKLSGKIDEKLPVPCMTIFNVSKNLMSGPIPEFNYSVCPKGGASDLARVHNPSFAYQVLFTCRPQLDTHLPVSDASFTMIHDISSNNFTGPIQHLDIAPEKLGKWTVYALLAGGNKFTGSFPGSLLGKCYGFHGMIINVSNNKLSGPIPFKIGAMCRSLRYLDASGNLLSGSIPPDLGDLESLVFLDLSRNQLHGQIPESMSHLNYLRYLSLANNNLSGTIPASFVRLDSLEVLKLSSNSLSGDIPEGLVNLKNISVFLLDNNKLSGHIPSGFSNVRSLSAFNASFNNLSGSFPLNSSVLNCSGVLGNPFFNPCHIASLATPSSDQPDSDGNSQYSPDSLPATDGDGGNNGINSIEIASIVCASAVVLVLLSLVILFFYTRKWIPDSRVQGFEYKEMTVFTDIGAPLTFENIVQATGNFNASNYIGSGGFGATYKAEIAPGTIVAVKRLAVGRFHGVQQFHAEIKTLGRVRHQNLVTLIGYHASETEMLLVYNYLPGGNLEDFIKQRSRRPFNWKVLHKIALDIAQALAYLHDQCIPRVLHRDVKPSNILLDDEFNAYLSDFGLSRLLGTSETHATTGVAGTFGYVAPEYAMTCRVSEKADVYSYGVVLLELISDKKLLDPSFSAHGNGFNIVSWACMMLRMGRANEVFMEGLWDAGPEDDLVEMLYLAVTCTVETLSIRPTMKQVVHRLRRIQPVAS